MGLITSKPFMGAALLSTALALSACATQDTAPQTTTPEDPQKISSVYLLKTGTHGDGVPIVYPTGTPFVTSRITTFPPHSKTSVHRHTVPLYAYILEGELTIHPEGMEPKVFKAGDAFMETSVWHYGTNETDKPLRLLAVYFGEVGAPLSVRKDEEGAPEAPATKY